MTHDPHQSLREHLLYLLKGGGAHLHFDKAVADIPPDLRGRTVPPVPHSPWRLLELVVRRLLGCPPEAG